LPPQVALLLTSCFVILVTYFEYKHNKDISKATWIITIWILYSASKGLGYYFNIKSTIESGSLPDRIFLLSLGIISILFLLKRKFRFFYFLRKSFLLTVIISYMLISSIWSQFPSISLRRWGREAIVIIIGSLLISEKYPVKALISSFRRVVYIAIPFSLMLIKYYPHLGRSYTIHSGELMWIGIAGQKNELALICAFSFIFLFWFLLESIFKREYEYPRLLLMTDISMLALSIYLFMGPNRSFNYSANAFFTLIFGFAFILFFKLFMNHKHTVRNLILCLATFIILIGMISFFTGNIPVKELPELLGRDTTLTGRIYIWSKLVPYAQKKLLLGYGFGGFWTTSLRTQIAVTAHNGYLDTILNLGILGLMLFLTLLMTLISKCSKLISDFWDIKTLFLAMVLMLLVHNIAESSLGYFEAFPSSLIILFYCIILEQETAKIDNL